MKRTVCALIAILSSAVAFADTEAKPAPLVLESKISLGAIRGRVDHLAVDVARQRLLVAELEHDSIGVVDLKQHTLTRTLNGFRQPQGMHTSQRPIPFTWRTRATGRCIYCAEMT
jgi:hypothetical protein